MNNRNKEWHDIWQRKYSTKEKVEHPHVLDGFDGMSVSEWKKLVSYLLTLFELKKEDDILEVGCGAGAFLLEVPEVKSISGIDYSERAIINVRQFIKGDFRVAEANKLPFKDNTFDVVMSFGVFFYFDSLDYAEVAFSEMDRVLRPNGTIFIGDISDLDKINIASKERANNADERNSKQLVKKKLDHLYFPKMFFTDLAEKFDYHIVIHDEDINELAFYYNSKYRYSIVLKKK